MERERRFRAFVVVDVAVAEPVAAAAGREVVQRPREVVLAEEPVERELRALAVLAVAGRVECRELRLHQRRRIERLLVTAPGCCFSAMTTGMTRQPQHPVGEAGLVTEPAERLEA